MNVLLGEVSQNTAVIVLLSFMNALFIVVNQSHTSRCHIKENVMNISELYMYVKKVKESLEQAPTCWQ